MWAQRRVKGSFKLVNKIHVNYASSRCILGNVVL